MARPWYNAKYDHDEDDVYGGYNPKTDTRLFWNTYPNDDADYGFYYVDNGDDDNYDDDGDAGVEVDDLCYISSDKVLHNCLIFEILLCGLIHLSLREHYFAFTFSPN